MSDIGCPDSTAFDVEAERVEYPLKTPASILEIVSTFLIHSDMAELTIFLKNCCFTLPGLTLGHSQGDGLTNPMLITVF